MYQIKKSQVPFISGESICRLTDNAAIPMDPANTDYQQFKTDVANGAPLEDPDGNVMTQEQINSFLETLP